MVKRIKIPADVADWIAQALKDSQSDKEQFHCHAIMRLQGHYTAVQERLDRAYEDRLAGRISVELWQRKSQEWERELETTRRDIAKHERASSTYTATGSKILELAKSAPVLFEQQNPAEQARRLKTLLSNCSFDRGTRVPAYVKPLTCSWRATKQEIGWEAGIRTPITWSRATCPTVERPPSARPRAPIG